MNRQSLAFFKESVWGKVVATSSVLFFLYLSDATMGYWVPVYMQKVLGGSLLMGLVMSFSSVIGILADLSFPQILKFVKTRKLMMMACLLSLVFVGVFYLSTYLPLVIFFLVSMGLWGIYYEFMGFGNKQFVVEIAPLNMRSGVWALIGAFKSLAYFLGPILGGWLLVSNGDRSLLTLTMMLTAVGLILLILTGKSKRNQGIEEDRERFAPKMELSHWKVLAEYIWPMLAMTVVLGMIDATFWTSGAVLSDELGRQSWYGSMLLPLYMLPEVFVGVLIAKMGIYQGKKKTSEIFFLVTGLFLCAMGMSHSLALILMASLGVGIATAVSWPLADAVYTDIAGRMGKEKKHVMGLTSSMFSLSYIIGPILSGYLSSIAGERQTFLYMGIFSILVASFLLVTTPRKIRLPEQEIQTW